MKGCYNKLEKLLHRNYKRKNNKSINDLNHLKIIKRCITCQLQACQSSIMAKIGNSQKQIIQRIMN